MRKRSLALVLALALWLGLSAPAGANDMGHVSQSQVLSCGHDHTAVIREDGTLWTMGGNGRGQLGNGSTEMSSIPVQVLDQVATVTCGRYETAVIRTDGSLWTWGLTQNRNLGLSAGDVLNESLGSMNQTKPYKVMEDVAAVACGWWHTAAIKSDGSLWTWGQNNEGQLGNGILGDQPSNSSWTDSFAGIESSEPEPETIFHVLDNVVAVACGQYHTAALKSDGTLWTWGSNYDGQLGSPSIDTKTHYPTPTQVLDEVVAVSCSDDSTAAIRADGSLWMWGSNFYGMITGDASAGDQPIPVKVMDDVSAVALGDHHAAVIKTDNSLWVWGDNDYGQIGSGVDRDEKPSYAEPVKVLDNVVAVSCGLYHTAAVTGDGTLYTWGENLSGQLGNGGTGNASYRTAEVPTYPEPIPSRTVYYQTVPAAIINNAAPGTLPSTVSPPTVGGFTDVRADDYFADPVLWAVDNGVTSGTSATTFSPDNTCTTAEIITFLWRASGSPAVSGGNPFSDVPAGAYYEQAALWAHENSLVSGSTFNGGTPCTRAATVTYLWKLAGQPASEAAAFADVPAGAEYAQAVAWAVQEGVTSGTSSTTFSPDDTCTRAQIVTFLYRDMA